MLNSNRNNNNNQNQIPENLINQNEINTTTKVKKILISKNNNLQNSPKRIIQSNRIYNRRVVSPRSYKIINKSPNRTYQAYPTEEAKAETESNNESNDYMNLYKNKAHDIIDNK